MSRDTEPLPPSAAELPGPFRHIYVHTRGLRLHAAVAGDRSHPLILLIHDSLGAWFDFRYLLSPLAEAGFYAAAIDLRGFGMSDKPPVSLAVSNLMLSDLIGTIGALGHQRAILVGAESGSALAWALATAEPEKVSALISISGVHPVDLRRSVAARPWHYPGALLHTASRLLPLRILASPRLNERAHRSYLRAHTLPGPLREAELGLRLRAARIGSARAWSVLTRRAQLSALPSPLIDAPLTAPTLFLHPNHTPWQHLVNRARTRVQGPFEHASIPGSLALPHLENPQGCAHLILGFLEQYP